MRKQKIEIAVTWEKEDKFSKNKKIEISLEELQEIRVLLENHCSYNKGGFLLLLERQALRDKVEVICQAANLAHPDDFII